MSSPNSARELVVGQVLWSDGNCHLLLLEKSVTIALLRAQISWEQSFSKFVMFFCLLLFFNTDHTKLFPHKFLKFHVAQIFDVSYILLPLSIFFRYITTHKMTCTHTAWQFG